ncbi:MAG: PASTA domain-containing protein [Candidatus Hydrogenedentes bacterium]|nr:PASTA domain-containing protein [Candidatus Hydrogenedentota bacterium]
MARKDAFGEGGDGGPVVYPPTRAHQLRMRAVLWTVLLGFGAIALRLMDVQVSPNFDLGDNTGQRALEIERGRIFDADGGILARDRLAPSLWVDPSKVREPEKAAKRLSALLDLDEADVLDKLTRCNAAGVKMRFVWIKRWLSDEEFEALGDLETLAGPGLAIRREYLRCYPENRLAAHVIGFVNRERVGCEGIEASFNQHLFSIPGRHKTRVDARRRFLDSLTLEYVPPRGGEDVYLTISKPIQHVLERELAAAMERCNAPRAMGLLMDPKTGAVLALACLPSFDPNDYGDYSAEIRKNRALLDVFEPGSSFKIVTASAAIEEHLITPGTPIFCHNGSFNPYGHRISDFHKLDTVSFQRAFLESSNIAMVKVAHNLGPARLEDWIASFGFGQPTSRDFTLESVGIFRPGSEWTRYSMGALPIGQEIAVTMPQLARAFSVIANGGYLVEPYLVERAVGREGEITYRHAPAAPKRVLSASTAQTMRDLCHLVVAHEHGTGVRANIEEFRVGGKTGTAQIARPDGRGYYADKYTAIFAGFAPIADPRICAVIVVQEPGIRLHYGGYVCGPVFKNVVREALILLGCPEDPVQDDGGHVEDAGTAQPFRLAEAAPGEGADLEPEPEHAMSSTPPDEPRARPGARPLAVAETPLIGAPSAGDEVQDADTAAVHYAAETIHEPPDEAVLADLSGLELAAAREDPTDSGPRLPDLRGMTKRQAREELVLLGLQWDARGSGWVVSQVPAPGTPIHEVGLCRLVFSNKGDASIPPAPQSERIGESHDAAGRGTASRL